MFEGKTMINYPIKESFNWLAAPEFKIVNTGKNTVTITGTAVRKDQVSKNNRKYVEEELQAAARTFIGKPVTINHAPYDKSHPMYDGRLVPGNVRWMEYMDTGEMNFQVDIKKQPYVDMLRNKSIEIQGVSIEADYIANRCNRCGKDFYSTETFEHHMNHEHFIKNFNYEPRGMIGRALSIVISPEIPGVPNTTINLMEKYQRPQFKGFSQLLETVIKTGKEKQNMAKPKTKVPYNHKETPLIRETEDEKEEDKKKQPEEDEKEKKTEEQEEPLSCPAGFHKVADEEGERCVADEEPAATEALDTPPTAIPSVGDGSTPTPTAIPIALPEQPTQTSCPTGQHLDTETGLCVADDSTVEPAPSVTVDAVTLPTLLELGEPFAGYDNVDDCKLKNPNKEDAGSYCADIMRKAEGEDVKETAPTKDVYSSLEVLGTIVQANARTGIVRDAKIAEKVNQLNRSTAFVFTQLSKLAESIDKSAKANLANVTKLIKTVESAAQINTLNETRKHQATQKHLKESFNIELKKATDSHQKLRETFNSELKKLHETQKSLQEYNTKHLGQLATSIAETSRKIPKPDTQTPKQVKEIFDTLEEIKTQQTNKLTETNQRIDNLPNITSDIEYIKNQLTEVAELATQQKKDFEQILNIADKNVERLTEKMKTLDEWKIAKEKELQETATKQKDTVDHANALKEAVKPLITKIENLESRLKGDTKQKHPQVIPQPEHLETEKLPYEK